MECKQRLEAYLREHDVPFESQRHEEAFTAQEVAASEHVPGRMLAKVVMVLADDHLTMLSVAAPHVVDLTKAKAVLGASEVRLAKEAEFAPTFLDCDVGAMPPFGSLYDVASYVDKVLAEDETITFNAGTHTDTMSVKYADFERVARPTVVDISRVP